MKLAIFLLRQTEIRLLMRLRGAAGPEANDPLTGHPANVSIANATLERNLLVALATNSSRT
jgi:hypothetical protein